MNDSKVTSSQLQLSDTENSSAMKTFVFLSLLTLFLTGAVNTVPAPPEFKALETALVKVLPRPIEKITKILKREYEKDLIFVP